MAPLDRKSAGPVFSMDGAVEQRLSPLSGRHGVLLKDKIMGAVTPTWRPSKSYLADLMFQKVLSSFFVRSVLQSSVSWGNTCLLDKTRAAQMSTPQKQLPCRKNIFPCWGSIDQNGIEHFVFNCLKLSFHPFFFHFTRRYHPYFPYLYLCAVYLFLLFFLYKH